MKNLLLVLGLWSMAFCNVTLGDTIPADNSLIEYSGRIDFSNPPTPMFSYSGVSIRACFTGTAVSVIMGDNVGQNYYNVLLNGKLVEILNVTTEKKTYKIAEGLNDTIHEIELFKRTEEQFGKTQFFGFVLDEGASLVPITPIRTKLIEYIGNSITCGYGNEGENGGTFGPTTENHYLTYAAITSRNFNARHMAVSKSGIGIYRNYDGPAAGNTDCMTNYYTRTFFYDENPKYSFVDRPDLVCINLGTNDFSTTGGDSAKYVSNYLRLIDTLQTKYSMPDIVCLLGTMMSGSTLTKVRNYLEFIADSASRKGKGNVTFFELSAQTGDLGLAIDYHPTVAQHVRNAIELTEYIKSLKGWKINPMVVNAPTVTAKHIQLEFNTPVHDSLNAYAGFWVGNDSTQYMISQIFRDSINPTILHMLLDESLSPAEKIYLRYTPGTIETDDSIKMGNIYDQEIQNTLTETKVTSGAAASDGRSVKLTFGKKLKPDSSIDGLTLTDNTGVIAIDSFSITSRYLTLYLNRRIVKGDSVFVSYNGKELLGEDEVRISSFLKFVIKNSSNFTSVPEIPGNSIDIFPNPSTNGLFYYRLNNTFEKPGVLDYEVLNVKGILVSKGTLSKTEGQIDLRGKVSTGIYLIKLMDKRKWYAQSVVIKK